MKILLGPEYVSDEAEPDSEEASEGEQEDARDTFVDRTTVRAIVQTNCLAGRLVVRWPFTTHPSPSRRNPPSPYSCKSLAPSLRFPPTNLCICVLRLFVVVAAVKTGQEACCSCAWERHQDQRDAEKTTAPKGRLTRLISFSLGRGGSHYINM